MSNERPSTTSNPLAGLVAIAILLIVLGFVAGLLISRSGTPIVVPTAAPAPTNPPAPTEPASVPTPITGSMPILPTATTYQYSSPPPMSIDPAKKYTATIYTPRGEIVIELLPDIARPRR